MTNLTVIVLWTGPVQEADQQARDAWLPAHLDDIPLREWNPAVAGQIIDLGSDTDPTA